MRSKGKIKVNTQNIFPIIKKWLYSDKDIFLRELVVNGCDAITKLKKLVAAGEAENNLPLRIDVKIDKENKTISITDNGIGMTEEEVKKYINQIAFSGAEEFLAKYQEQDEGSQIIGHFGLGFYSAFMVAQTVELDTKSYTGAQAVRWTCDGGTDFEMRDIDRAARGTSILLHLAEDSEEFLQPERLRSILLKYCSFLPYEIYLNDEEQPINDVTPLWSKAPSDCTKEEYIAFYHKLFSDYNDPLFWIHLNVEYPFNLKGILYFPKLTHEFESAQGEIKLYNNQVFVAENIKEVTPEFLMLLKGVIDCPDIPLNVSRSALQNDGQVAKISSHITKKVADKLVAMHKDEKEDFDKYWNDIAPFFEYGCMRDEKFYQKLRPVLQVENIDGEFVSLIEYAEANKNEITYVSSESQQSQYIKMLKNSGKAAVIMPHLIDLHFISFLEATENWKFNRVDSLPEEKEEEHEVIRLFKDILDKKDLKIILSSLPSELPAIIAMDEETRRMSDITKLFGSGITPQTLTLVLNSGNDIIKLLPSLEKEKQQLFCEQIYDLARLCHSPFTPEDLSKFADRSTKIMRKLL